MRTIVRVCFFLAILLMWPLAGRAQQCTYQNPFVSFGEVGNVPVTVDACYTNSDPSNTCYSPCYLYQQGSTISGPFTISWPNTLSTGGGNNIPVTFDPKIYNYTPGSYSGSFSASYWSSTAYSYSTVTVTASGQWGNPVSGFIKPKYVIVSVQYNPPGTNNTATYTNNTVVGNSMATTGTFSTNVTQSVSSSGLNGIIASIFGPLHHYRRRLWPRRTPSWGVAFLSAPRASRHRNSFFAERP